MVNPGECGIYFAAFDETDRRPRTVPCGHTFCSACLGSMVQSGNVACPDCRAHHPASNATQFPINYGMEAFIKHLKDKKLTKTPSAPEAVVHSSSPEKKILEEPPCAPSPKQSAGISSKLQSLVKEQQNCMTSLVTVCHEMQSELDQYQVHLGDWETEHCQLHDELNDLMKKNKAAVNLVQQEYTRVVAEKKEGECIEERLKEVLKYQQAVTTPQEVETAIHKTEHCSIMVEAWKQRCQQLFPHVSTVATSWTRRWSTREALNALPAEDNFMETNLTLSPNPVCTITGKIMDITKHLTVKEFWKMSRAVLGMVGAGKVVAVQNGAGLCSSRITLENDRVYLHCLEDQPSPADAIKLPINEVVDSLDDSCTVTFLDLAWEGSTRGRMHIRLSRETPLASQFVLLCTGQRGPSYRNTSLLQVIRRDGPGERVFGGDYECNNGSGGRMLVPNTLGKYHWSAKAGAVYARFPEVDCNAILTAVWNWLSGKSVSIWKPSRLHRCPVWHHSQGFLRNAPCVVFGEVESGLELLKDAVANIRDIREVKVSDCGVVLSR